MQPFWDYSMVPKHMLIVAFFAQQVHRQNVSYKALEKMMVGSDQFPFGTGNFILG